MKTVFKVLGLFVWLCVLALVYGAIWNRHPAGFFPVPPESISNWLATHYLADFDIEDKTDIIVFIYSFVASCLISLFVWTAISVWKKIR